MKLADLIKKGALAEATVATVATVAVANGASTTNQINNSSSFIGESCEVATATVATPATHGGFKPIPKCLGIRCGHAGYVTEPDNLVALWCGQEGKAVFEIPSCPNGHWQKDKKGFPIPDPKLWVESWNAETDDSVIL